MENETTGEAPWTKGRHTARDKGLFHVGSNSGIKCDNGFAALKVLNDLLKATNTVK